MWLHLYKILKYANHWTVTEYRSAVPADKSGGRNVLQRDMKKLGKDENVYFDCGDGFTDAYMCQSCSCYIL